MKPAVHRAYTTCAQAVHRFGASAVLAALVAGCGPQARVSGEFAIPYRNPTAPLGVTSRYDDAAFSGTWHLRGAYPEDADLIEVARGSGDASTALWTLTQRRCDPDGQCTVTDTVWRATVDVPGADRLADPDGGPDRRAVVVWVDDGFRTAAVAGADGRFAWVLDRAPRGGADRIAAARRVLEFSGFDLSDMQMRP